MWSSKRFISFVEVSLQIKPTNNDWNHQAVNENHAWDLGNHFGNLDAEVMSTKKLEPKSCCIFLSLFVFEIPQIHFSYAYVQFNCSHQNLPPVNLLATPIPMEIVLVRIHRELTDNGCWHPSDIEVHHQAFRFDEFRTRHAWGHGNRFKTQRKVLQCGGFDSTSWNQMDRLHHKVKMKHNWNMFLHRHVDMLFWFDAWHTTSLL